MENIRLFGKNSKTQTREDDPVYFKSDVFTRRYTNFKIFKMYGKYTII
jgi:hypothetical protein